MQEEIEQKTFNIMISTTKLSARTVLRAVKAALRLYQSKASQGKQSVRTLLRQNRGVSSVEISKTGIRGLERYAKKYGIDYERVHQDKRKSIQRLREQRCMEQEVPDQHRKSRLLLLRPYHCTVQRGYLAPSSAVPPARFIASFRSPSFPPWRSPCWLRWY